jgi:Flp pilus assembly protein CpaB
MTYRMRNILIAVALAGLAALLVTFYISNYKKSVQHGEAQVAVYVAAQDIPLGTLGSAVASGGLLKTEQIARTAVVPGAISSPDQIKALVAIAPVYAGEQVTTRRFGPLVQQGIKGQITGTYRAMQVSGSADQVLSGTLQPGDSVDVLAAFREYSGDSLIWSRVVLHDLKVLSVQAPGGTTSKIGASTSLSAVMLRMTDTEAQKMAWLVKSADYWALALRPAIKSTDSPNSEQNGPTMVTDSLSPAALGIILHGLQTAPKGH